MRLRTTQFLICMKLTVRANRYIKSNVHPCAHVGVTTELPSFLTSIFEGSGQFHVMSALTLVNTPTYSLNRRLRGTQSRYGRSKEVMMTIIIIIIIIIVIIIIRPILTMTVAANTLCQQNILSRRGCNSKTTFAQDKRVNPCFKVSFTVLIYTCIT